MLTCEMILSSADTVLAMKVFTAQGVYLLLKNATIAFISQDNAITMVVKIMIWK